MKKFVVLSSVVFAVFILSSSVLAGQIGAPQPIAEEGNFAIGLGYYYDQLKIKPKDSNTQTFGDTKSTSNQIYIQGNYAFSPMLEGYVKVGGADLKIKDVFEFDTGKKDYKKGYELFGGVGVKGTVYETEQIVVAPFLEVNIYSESAEQTETGTEGGMSASIKAKVKDRWDVTLGVAAQTKLDSVLIYGGPIAYWSRATFSGESSAGGVLDSVSEKTKAKNNIGAVIGATMDVAEGVAANVELQYKGKVGVGITVTKKI